MFTSCPSQTFIYLFIYLFICLYTVLYFFNETVLTMRLPSWNGVTSNSIKPWITYVLTCFYRGIEKHTRTILKNINFVLFRMSHSLKVPYMSRISYRVPHLVFLKGGRALIWRGRLFQILSLRRGANSKRDAYVKLGANSSIYGIHNYNKLSSRVLLVN